MLNGFFGEGETRHIAHWRAVKYVDEFNEEGEAEGETIIRKRERFSHELTLAYESGQIIELKETKEAKPRMKNAHERFGNSFIAVVRRRRPPTFAFFWTPLWRGARQGASLSPSWAAMSRSVALSAAFARRRFLHGLSLSFGYGEYGFAWREATLFSLFDHGPGPGSGRCAISLLALGGTRGHDLQWKVSSISDDHAFLEVPPDATTGCLPRPIGGRGCLANESSRSGSAICQLLVNSQAWPSRPPAENF